MGRASYDVFAFYQYCFWRVSVKKSLSTWVFVWRSPHQRKHQDNLFMSNSPGFSIKFKVPFWGLPIRPNYYDPISFVWFTALDRAAHILMVLSSIHSLALTFIGLLTLLKCAYIQVTLIFPIVDNLPLSLFCWNLSARYQFVFSWLSAALILRAQACQDHFS